MAERRKLYATLANGERVAVRAERIWHISLERDLVPEDGYFNPKGYGPTRAAALAEFTVDHGVDEEGVAA